MANPVANVVKLNIGGCKYVTTLQTLISRSDEKNFFYSFLGEGEMFKSAVDDEGKSSESLY
jgi:hypothetical protein